VLWHVLIHIIVRTLSDKDVKEGPPPPLQRPRDSRSSEEAILWAGQDRRRNALRARMVPAAVGHGICALLWLGSALARDDGRTGAGFRSTLLPGLYAAGTISLGVWWCALSAQSRGRSALWGLLGVLSVVGYLLAEQLGRLCASCGTVGGAGALCCPRCLAPV